MIVSQAAGDGSHPDRTPVQLRRDGRASDLDRCYRRAVDLHVDADAVRALGRGTRHLVVVVAAETRGAESALAQASAAAGQDDLVTAIGQLRQTLTTAHAGVARGLVGFAAELDLAAQTFETTDRELAADVPEPR